MSLTENRLTCWRCHRPLSHHRARWPITLSGIGYLVPMHPRCLKRERVTARRKLREYINRRYPVVGGDEWADRLADADLPEDADVV